MSMSWRWTIGWIIIAAVIVVAAIVELRARRVDETLSHSVAVAEQTWGLPCGGKVPPITYKRFPADILGRATLRLVGGVYVTCKIELDDRRWSAERRCATIVHEWGHLKREDNWHSSDPDSIMYPQLSSRNVPADC